MDNPDRVAIIDDAKKVSYRSLIELAIAVKDSIVQHEYKGDWVPVSCSDGWKSYASILGVWLSGKGYVPINIAFPKTENVKKLNQVNESRIITHDVIEGYESVLVQEAKEVLTDVEFPEYNYAYLIFTSGTTGKPKGVPIKFSQLSAFVDHYFSHQEIKFTSQDRFLQSYALTFDVSVFCYLTAFHVGGTLVLPESTTLKFQGLFKAIEQHQITVVSFVPSVIRLSFDFLHRLKLPSVRYSFFSGESLQGDWAIEWMKTVHNAQVYNCYGPTETVIVCTEEHLNQLDPSYFERKEPLPLGKPFGGVDIKLKANELVFKGDQVFDGYLNQAVLEDYYSGDLGKLDQNGKLIFLGRKDNQIQWNGYRIELEEIETRFFTEKGVKVKSVFLSEDQQLVLFSTSKRSVVLAGLKELFPPYYMPSRIIELDAFPLNANEKYDWGQLKEWAKKNLE